MNWFTNLFRTPQKKILLPSFEEVFKIKEEEEEKKYSSFTIEHYPLTRKYTVRYKNKGWLKTAYHTGIIRVETLFDIVDFYSTEESARRAIALYEEQKNKNGVQYITVK